MKTYAQLMEDLGEVRSKLMKRQRENVSSFAKRVKPKSSFKERLRQKAIQKKLDSLKDT
jgi:ppGpp synthetase/RelA/SpoT-type nucleotidyltranferase